MGTAETGSARASRRAGSPASSDPSGDRDGSAASASSEDGRTQAASPHSAEPETHVVIDLTDAAIERHGGPVIDPDPPAAAATAPVARPTPWHLRPLALLLAVNALNVADTLLTIRWIEVGIAIEGNPFVRAIGFPAKVVGVALGSLVMYRLRPRWLLVPIAALALVFAYHIVGAAVTLAR